MSWPEEAYKAVANFVVGDRIERQTAGAYKVWVATRDVELAIGGHVTAGCLFWLQHPNQRNMFFDPSHWVDAPAGVVPLVGGTDPEGIAWWEENGLTLVNYNEPMSIGVLVSGD